MASPTITVPATEVDMREEAVAARVEEVSTFLSMSPDVVEAAMRNVASKAAVLLVVSGKLASGKDTVAPVLLERLGYDQRVHLYYALALKDEVDLIIAEIRATYDPIGSRNTDAMRQAFAEDISMKFNLPATSARFYATELADAALADPALTSRSRTELMRKVLQHHGTDVRRAQDDNYWVKKSLRPAIEALAAGSSVFYTDARFTNEVDWARSCGAFPVRLDVTRATQLMRLRSRDGMSDPAPETFTHKSETELDDYPHFAVRLSNDGDLEDTLVAAAAVFAGF